MLVLLPVDADGHLPLTVAVDIRDVPAPNTEPPAARVLAAVTGRADAEPAAAAG